ncbi:hypothetical protein FQR65_LT20257 [Abscondita terminalis]|nr:hypothetical protein FQR65_LT20257 [Abscondita terminalis]
MLIEESVYQIDQRDREQEVDKDKSGYKVGELYAIKIPPIPIVTERKEYSKNLTACAFGRALEMLARSLTPASDELHLLVHPNVPNVLLILSVLCSTQMLKSPSSIKRGLCRSWARGFDFVESNIFIVRQMHEPQDLPWQVVVTTGGTLTIGGLVNGDVNVKAGHSIYFDRLLKCYDPLTCVCNCNLKIYPRNYPDLICAG